MSDFSLKRHGITVIDILRNASPAVLYEEAILNEVDSKISSSGALLAYSGLKTGRSPKDKHVVKNTNSEKDVWWGNVNVPISQEVFQANRKCVLEYLNGCQRLYCTDGFIGWDKKYRIKVRIIASRPYHALFMWNMMIRPSPEELLDFDSPDLTIFNAGVSSADPQLDGITSKTSIDLNIESQEVTILGTEYAGEMKTVSFSPEEEQNPPNNRMCQGCVGRVTHALRRPAPLASARKRPTRTPPRRTMSQSQVPRPHKDVATKKRRRKRRRRKNTRHKR